MFKLVLLALADTSAGLQAVRLAAALAARHGAGFAVLHVSGPLSQEGGCVLHLPGEGELAARRAEVEALCRVAMPPGLTADVMQSAGFVHVEVLKAARLLAPDLLVLAGLDEAERCRRELTGTASMAALLIAAAAPCPVLLAPAEAAQAPLPFRRVLAAVDLSGGTCRVLGAACRLASAEGAALRAFHALPQAAGTPQGEGPETLERTLRQACDRLEYLCGAMPEHLAVGRAAREGEPVQEILKDAREYGADLLVLASEAYGGDAAVPARVLAGARCPVLLVGPQVQPARQDTSAQRPQAVAEARG